MQEVLFESILQIITRIVIIALGLAGTWVMTKLAQTKKFDTLAAAVEEATSMAQQTVGELQQTLVDDWKAASVDGKLTDDQIALLKQRLLELTKSKMSDAAIKLITGANQDINAIIEGAAESWLQVIKSVK